MNEQIKQLFEEMIEEVTTQHNKEITSFYELLDDIKKGLAILEVQNTCTKDLSFNHYQNFAIKKAKSIEEKDLILNGCLGLGGESGEVIDLIKKHLFQGHELDKKKIANELGDICWYIAILAKGIGYDLDRIFKMNIDKLTLRYPNGFETIKSVKRNENS